MKRISGQGVFVIGLAAAVVTAWSGGARDGVASHVTSQGAVPAGAGSALKPGARLTYGSAGGEQPPWTIDSVQQGVALGGRTGCTRLYLRLRPDQTTPAARITCRSGDTLFAWTAATSTWRADRPLGAGMQLSVPQASGAVLEYATSTTGDTTISGVRLGFVRTVITTRDAQGRATRRLTERYAVAIATALGGLFEVPDSSAAGGWRESQRFDLVRVEIP